MRGLTLAIVAGAVVVLVAAALYLRSGDTGSETALAPGAGASKKLQQASSQGGSAPDQGAGSAGMERSSRVEERLGQLRDDFQRRQVDGGNPQAAKREVPTMAPSKRQAMEAAGKNDSDDADDEDPEEMEELKHTLLSDPDPDERIGAVLMLTGEEGPESLGMLLEAMGDPDPEVRLAVVEALGDRAEELSPDTLHSAMKDSDPEVRFEAVSILGDMETPEALQLVRAALNDQDEDVRALAEGILDLGDDNNAPAAQAPQPTPKQNGQPHM